METVNYKLALQAAEAEMRDLLQERSNIDARLGSLKQTIEGLSALIQEQPKLDKGFDDAGISDAIRALLHVSKVPLSPVQIRGSLVGRGFDLSDYANPMSVIHNTLKRLESQGELLTVKDSAGKAVAYTTRWVGPGSAERSGIRGSSTTEEITKDAERAAKNMRRD
jgi:hypothetical protein